MSSGFHCGTITDLHIDEIRKLSLDYAAGNPPRKKKQPKSIRNKHKYRIDIRSLATYLANPVSIAARDALLQRLHLTYTEYIHTDHWKSFRFEYLHSLQSTKCEVTLCKRRGDLLHHKCYTRLGAESYDDVYYVCYKCHDKIHKEIQRIKRNRHRNKEILGGITPHRSLTANNNEKNEMEPDSFDSPWGGLFARRLVPA